MMVNLPCLMVSCTNFLRPTCPYTGCLLSFLTGSCPTEGTTAGYSSCLYLDFTGLSVPQGTDIPWTLPLPHFAGLCDDAVPVVLHRYRVPFQNPARFRTHPEPGRALELMMLPKCLMLQPLLSSPDHRPCHSSVSCRLSSEVYRLSQSMTASFSADYRLVSYSTYGVL